MGEVVSIAKPLEKLVLEIRGHVHDAGRAENTCAKHQLQAGLRLIELRASVERDGGDWWSYYDEQFTGHIKSRKYAERLMRWAKSDDPEGAINAERERVRDAVKESRQRAANDGQLRNNQAESSSERTEYDIVNHALRLVGEMDAPQLASFEEGFNALLQKRHS